MPKKSLLKKGYLFISGSVLSVVSAKASADSIPAINGASEWVVNAMIGIAVSVIGMQIIYKLWQVNQGQKEPSEVVKPILITAAIVATPTIIGLIISAMGYQ
jgi:cytochrome c biogenesis protein CcdA